jgi:hypothetical protein
MIGRAEPQNFHAHEEIKEEEGQVIVSID